MGMGAAPFITAEQTGTGANQLVAHNIGWGPTLAFIVPTDTSPATVGVFTVTNPVDGNNNPIPHDGKNFSVNVTSGKKFKIVAFF
jgi:hypothetical protein